MAMMGSSRSLPGRASWPRMAANMVFQPLEQLVAGAARADGFDQIRRTCLVVRDVGDAHFGNLGGSGEQGAEQQQGGHGALLSHDSQDPILLRAAFAAPVAIAGRHPQLAGGRDRDLPEPSQLLPEVD